MISSKPQPVISSPPFAHTISPPLSPSSSYNPWRMILGVSTTRSITTWSTSKLKTTSLITKHQDTINSEATNPGTTDHILTLQHTPLHSSRKPSGTGITFLEIQLATHPSMPSSLHWGVFRWSNHISAIFTCTLYIMHHVHLLVVFETTHVPTAVRSIFCD